MNNFIEYPRRQGKRAYQEFMLLETIKKAKDGDKILIPQIGSEDIVLTVNRITPTQTGEKDE